MNNYSRFYYGKKSISNIRGQKQWAQMRWGGCRGCGTAKETIRKKRTKVEIKVNILTFPACFRTPMIFSNLNPNCSNLLDMRNLEKQVKKCSVTSHDTVIGISSVTNKQTLKQFFLTVGQNNFGNKIPYG